MTIGAPTWGTSQVVTAPMTIGAPSSDDEVRPVLTEQPTSIPWTPQPRRRPRISLWELPADQLVNLSTTAVVEALVV